MESQTYFYYEIIMLSILETVSECTWQGEIARVVAAPWAIYAYYYNNIASRLLSKLVISLVLNTGVWKKDKNSEVKPKCISSIYTYTYLLLLISMLWPRQAIFEGDKLSTSVEECMIRTHGLRKKKGGVSKVYYVRAPR